MLGNGEDTEIGQAYFESDCINQVLVTLLWFARYSPQTSKVTEKLLTRHAKSIQKLFENNLDTTNWGLLMMNISQLMFAATELKHLFTTFIEPYTNIFTQIALKELTN